MSKPLPRGEPHAEGVNPAAVTAFIGAIEHAKLELHSFMLLRHGRVVAEGSWKPYSPERPHMLFSLSKSFTSTAVGFAVADGLLTVDDPVLKFFPQEAPEKPGKYWNELKVRHLLSMSTGHDADTTEFLFKRRDGDWAKAFLRRPLKHKPGTHFLYNTGATYMLSVIVQKLTGMRVLDYLEGKLFRHLGIEGAAWERCPKGYDTGGFGLSVKVEDIARFGQFLLQRGMWEGRQLLPAAWVDEATSKQVENGAADGTNDWGEGYGYQFWRCIPGCYRGDGAFGQYCIVVPKLDAVIAITSGVSDMGAVMANIWKLLLPAMGEGQPGGPEAAEEMRARLAGLRYDPPALRERSTLEAALSGKAFALEKNREGLTRIAFRFEADRCAAEVSRGRRKTRLLCGRGRWLESSYSPATNPSVTPMPEVLSAASFGWEDENTLVITSRDVKAPFVTTMRARFEAGGIELKTAVNVSFGPPETPPVKGKPVE